MLGQIPWTPDLAAAGWEWDEMEWVDPSKETSANAEAMATGQKSIVEVCAGRGADWRVVQDQNLEAEAREIARREELGLPPKASSVPTAPTVPQDPEDPEDSDIPDNPKDSQNV
jgi:capsid protein